MPFTTQVDSFETDFGNWSNDTGDNFDWQRNNSTTPSSGTGPGGAYVGSWYIYTETSSPVANGNEAQMTNQTTLDGSLYAFTLTFREHMVGMGDGTGYLVFEAFKSSTWTEVYRQTGDNGATENGTDYVLRTVVMDSATGGPYDNSDFQLRFRLHVSDGGNAYQNDGALDDIQISGVDRASLDQEGYRFRNDDGSESAATWRQGQDTVDTVGKDTNIRLRILIDASGNPNSEQFQLEYKEASDGAGEWRAVPLT